MLVRITINRKKLFLATQIQPFRTFNSVSSSPIKSKVDKFWGNFNSLQNLSNQSSLIVIYIELKHLHVFYTNQISS